MIKGYFCVYNGWVLKNNILYRFENNLLHNKNGPAYLVLNINDVYPITNAPVSVVNSVSSVSNIVGGTGKVEERYYLNGVYFIKEDWEKEILVRKLSGIK